LQSELYETIIPNLIKKNDPLLDDGAMAARRNQVIARPSLDPASPSPHVTGGAVDVILRYKQTAATFIADVNVPMGHYDGDTAYRINPDYFEYHYPVTPAEQLAQRNRRAFFAIM